jgi:hypothetical protein
MSVANIAMDVINDVRKSLILRTARAERAPTLRVNRSFGQAFIQ